MRITGREVLERDPQHASLEVDTIYEFKIIKSQVVDGKETILSSSAEKVMTEKEFV